MYAMFLYVHATPIEIVLVIHIKEFIWEGSIQIAFQGWQFHSSKLTCIASSSLPLLLNIVHTSNMPSMNVALE